MQEKITFDKFIRWAGVAALVILVLAAVNYLSNVLLPFFIAWFLAYLLYPAVKFVQNRMHVPTRALSIVVTLIAVIAVVGLVVYLIIPPMIEQFQKLGGLVTKYIQTSANIDSIPGAIQEWLQGNQKAIEQFFRSKDFTDGLQKAMPQVFSFLGHTASLIISIVASLITLLYMFFILLDYDKITHSFKAAIPPKYRRIGFKIIRDVEQTMSRYFRGQALVSLFVGIIFAIEFSIIGLPMAIAFGLFIGVLNMVPYLQLVSLPIAAFLCLVLSVDTGQPFWPLFGWTFAAYCICQLIQDLVLIPMIMKQQMGLKPAIVFLALSVWGYILGLVGLIIALPMTTLIISYYCEYVLHTPNPLYNKKRKIKKKRNSHIAVQEPTTSNGDCEN